MEKIISINFHGRVIPIEETAYNKLKEYIESLRRHFAKEESSDEIINDIESRIAELLGDRLKRGAPCIVGSDVAAVIDSIGQLEDIEAAEGEEPAGGKGQQPHYEERTYERTRFYRNENDKVIAGVCSGLAARLGVDPLLVRIIFVVLGGALLWVYLVLWLIVPAGPVPEGITRRLYRNPDDKEIAGVCGGLASYFGVDNKIVRAIFAIPFIFTIVSGGANMFWWNWPWGGRHSIVIGSLGSTLFLAYLILWIAVPYASSPAEKLVMRGEKVDMNTLKAATQARAKTSTPSPRRSGLGHVLAVLLKAFFIFVAGSIAVGLFAGLIGLIFGGVAIMPFTDFFVENKTQLMLGSVGVILVLGIPMLALITWMIRRLAGARSRRHGLAYVFAGLWIGGLVCASIVAATVMEHFATSAEVEESFAMAQPSGNKLYVNVNPNQLSGVNHYRHRWFGDDYDDDAPFRMISSGQMWLNTVRVKVLQSPDSQYHIYKISSSRGETPEQAKAAAEHISFSISQNDSVVTLADGFLISKNDKFRNQRVIVAVEVPVGKGIRLDRTVENYEWFTVSSHRPGHMRIHRRESYRHRSDRDYVMTASGLQDSWSDSSERYDNDDE